MTQTRAWAVENPPEELQVFEPPQIRRGGKFGPSTLKSVEAKEAVTKACRP